MMKRTVLLLAMREFFICEKNILSPSSIQAPLAAATNPCFWGPFGEHILGQRPGFD
jgi:hypothetical protein